VQQYFAPASNIFEKKIIFIKVLTQFFREKFKFLKLFTCTGGFFDWRELEGKTGSCTLLKICQKSARSM
jgi:hypothetical protein